MFSILNPVTLLPSSRRTVFFVTVFWHCFGLGLLRNICWRYKGTVIRHPSFSSSSLNDVLTCAESLYWSRLLHCQLGQPVFPDEAHELKEFLALKQLRPQGYRTIRFIGFRRVLSRAQLQGRVHHVRHSSLPCGRCFENCSRGFVSWCIILVWVISWRDEAASNKIIVRAYCVLWINCSVVFGGNVLKSWVLGMSWRIWRRTRAVCLEAVSRYAPQIFRFNYG